MVSTRDYKSTILMQKRYSVCYQNMRNLIRYIAANSLRDNLVLYLVILGTKHVTATLT
jgi:hypothetical protein